jgi:hypothetical protein
MVVVPLTLTTVSSRPACITGSSCGPTPQGLQATLILDAGLIVALTGFGTITTASLLMIRNVTRPAYYGMTLISLAVIHLASLLSSILFYPPPSSEISVLVVYLIGPLLAFWSGGLLLKEKKQLS